MRFLNLLLTVLVAVSTTAYAQESVGGVQPEPTATLTPETARRIRTHEERIKAIIAERRSETKADVLITESDEQPLSLEQTDRTASYFGINGSKAFHIPEDEATIRQRLEWMQEAGVYWDRVDLWWGVVKPGKDQPYDFSRSDRVFDLMEEYKVQWYPIFCYGGAWFDPDRTEPQSDEDFALFTDYVREVTGRYKGRAQYWSMWNEPNISEFWKPNPNPDAYFRLMKKSYAAMKEANPDAKLCAPVLAPLGSWDRKFTERVFELGGMDYFDVWDYHYYRNQPPEKEVPQEIAEIRGLMRRYGKEKPMWISESGVTSIPGGRPMDENRKAALVVRNHLLAFASGVERFFYFDLQNWSDDDYKEWGSQLGLITAAGEKKPAFHTYKTMVSEVDRKEFVGRVDGLGPNTDGVLVYDKDHNDYILIPWTTDDSEEVFVFTAEPRNVMIVYPFGEGSVCEGGRPRAPGEQAQNCNLMIGPSPIYIHAADPFTYLPRAGVRLEPPYSILAQGEAAPVNLFIHPNIKNPGIAYRAIDTPEGIEWDSLTETLRVSEKAEPGVHEFSVVVSLTHGTNARRDTVVLRRTAQVEVLPTMSLSFQPYMDEGKLMADARVLNQSAKPRSGSIELIKTEGDAEEKILTLELDPLESRSSITKTFEISRDVINTVDGVAALQLRYGSTSSRPVHIYPIPFTERAPQVDGKLDDWSSVPPMMLNQKSQIVHAVGGWSPRDASADCRFLLTPEKLYVAADITDDDPMVNNQTLHEMWREDSLEIYIGFGGPGKRTVINKAEDFQIGLAPRQKDLDRPGVFWFHEDVPLHQYLLVVKESEKGYVMEAAIPLTEIGMGEVELEDGKIILLDSKLNDYDSDDIAPAGNNPGRNLVWNGTSTNWIDPSNWGIAVLRKQ